ncbi:MAG: hypothetical protein OXF47_01835 [Nitrospira sp.]|nr:hypothetical protein [Nitrospira sp.]
MSMELREDIRETLASEFNFAVGKMEQSQQEALELLYYYSAFFGAVHRALNVEWNRELALCHLVMNSSYKEMQIAVEQRILNFVPPNMPEILTNACKEIARLFETNTITTENLYPLLAKIAELSYATTGNGHYNVMKGNLKLQI